ARAARGRDDAAPGSSLSWLRVVALEPPPARERARRSVLDVARRAVGSRGEALVDVHVLLARAGAEGVAGAEPGAPRRDAGGVPYGKRSRGSVAMEARVPHLLVPFA